METRMRKRIKISKATKTLCVDVLCEIFMFFAETPQKLVKLKFVSREWRNVVKFSPSYIWEFVLFGFIPPQIYKNRVYCLNFQVQWPVNFNLDELVNLRELDLNKNEFISLEPGVIPCSVRVLNLRNNWIQSLKLRVIPNGVLVLDLSNNYFTFMEIGVIPNSVQKLDLSYNKLTSLDPDAIPSGVKMLNLWGNPIKNKEQLLEQLKLRGIEKVLMQKRSCF